MDNSFRATSSAFWPLMFVDWSHGDQIMSRRRASRGAEVCEMDFKMHYSHGALTPHDHAVCTYMMRGETGCAHTGRHAVLSGRTGTVSQSDKM